ncbi:hypothetical protein [Pseudomonas sp. PS02302]|uniref:hypothetical protein n=1 Tax=Pseudomonas sp. PS02302 TaxID=2991428 RepID=UPI00249A1DAD|nr:hypothetical protein [Pseudomonas sp. PS02302]
MLAHSNCSDFDGKAHQAARKLAATLAVHMKVAEMGYDARDTRALQVAAANGIQIVGQRVVRFAGGDQFLFTMKCPSQLVMDNPEGADSEDPDQQSAKSTISPAGECLSQAIEAVTRIHAGARLWVQVDGDVMPEFVREAVADLEGFGTRMVVTQGNACSHAPGPLLDPMICKAVIEANEGTQVWHPFADKPVFQLNLA